MKLRSIVTGLGIATAAVALAGGSYAQQTNPQVKNDYPTVTRAEYIFGCMQVNGNSRLSLERCSCSIDVIADILPFEKYVDAETTMSMRLRGGESVSYMQGPQYVEKIKALKLAQIEGELRCF